MSSQNILITGVNGFVGRALCSELVRQGYKVHGVVRDISSITAIQCELTEMQSIENADWSSILVGVDVIVHLAARVHVMHETISDPLAAFRATNVDATLNIARQAANAGVKRFVFLSSIKVNGELTSEGKPFTESDAPNPHDAYATSKHEAEQGLLLVAQRTGMEVVIIRPPLVYGPGVKANFSSMMRIVKRGIPLPLGSIHNKRSFVYVQNLVSLIVRTIDHPAAANQVFLVSDGCDLSTTELLRKCAAALKVSSRLLPVPQAWFEAGATFIGKRDVAQRLCGNLQVDISKSSKFLDWTPSVSVTDGLRATAKNLIKD